MDEQEYIRQEYKKGTPTKVIARNLGISSNAVQKRATRDIDCPPHGGIFDNGKIGEDGSLKGELTMARKVEVRSEMSEQEQSYYRKLMESHGLRFEDYPYFWDKTTVEGFSLFCRNPEYEKAKQASLDEFFKRIEGHAPKYPRIKYKPITDGHLKLIDMADVHIGKYVVGRDGKTSYDKETAIRRSHEAVEALLVRSQGFPTEKFLLPIGNDILHVDNKNNTTTKGTRQDVNGLWWEAYDAAHAMYVAVIERLVPIAPVEIVYNRSNHDEHLGFTLSRGLQAWFRNTPDVTFTVTQNDREYIKYGRNMIGLQHGDGAKMKDLPLLMAAEEPKMWGDTIYRFIICHHVHHWKKTQFLMAEDMPGVTVEYMRSPSAADDYHQKHGYVGAPEAIDAFIFHPKWGKMDHMSCVFTE